MAHIMCKSNIQTYKICALLMNNSIVSTIAAILNINEKIFVSWNVEH